MGISELVKEFILRFLGLHRVMTKPEGDVKQMQPVSRIRVSILYGVGPLLAAINLGAAVRRQHVDVSSKRYCIWLNCLSPNHYVRELLGRKYYHILNI